MGREHHDRDDRPEDGAEPPEGRERLRIAEALAAAAGGVDPRRVPGALCRTCLDPLPVTGASVSIATGQSLPMTWYSSDDTAARAGRGQVHPGRRPVSDRARPGRPSAGRGPERGGGRTPAGGRSSPTRRRDSGYGRCSRCRWASGAGRSQPWTCTGAPPVPSRPGPADRPVGAGRGHLRRPEPAARPRRRRAGGRAGGRGGSSVMGGGRRGRPHGGPPGGRHGDGAVGRRPAAGAGPDRARAFAQGRTVSEVAQDVVARRLGFRPDGDERPDPDEGGHGSSAEGQDGERS